MCVQKKGFQQGSRGIHGRVGDRRWLVGVQDDKGSAEAASAVLLLFGRRRSSERKAGGCCGRVDSACALCAVRFRAALPIRPCKQDVNVTFCCEHGLHATMARFCASISRHLRANLWSSTAHCSHNPGPLHTYALPERLRSRTPFGSWATRASQGPTHKVHERASMKIGGFSWNTG